MKLPLKYKKYKKMKEFCVKNEKPCQNNLAEPHINSILVAIKSIIGQATISMQGHFKSP